MALTFPMAFSRKIGARSIANRWRELQVQGSVSDRSRRMAHTFPMASSPKLGAGIIANRWPELQGSVSHRPRRMAHTFPMASSPKLGAESIANRWRELQGSGIWAGLLDPLDSDLRASLIAYGELAQVTYDVFDTDESSAEAGQCIYPAAVLAASGVSHPEYYTITKFLYATCDFRPYMESETESESESGNSVAKALFVKPEGEVEGDGSWAYTNWIGYVAVATDEGVVALGRRDIVVAWRGSVKVEEFVKDIYFPLTSAELLVGKGFENAKVHRGFLSVYTTTPRTTENHQLLQVCPGQTTDSSVIVSSAQDQARAEVLRLMEVHKEEVTSITVTGHSLGGSLATLNAIDLVAHQYNAPPDSTSMQPPCPVTAILFASPRVGNKDFKNAFASFPELRALSVINNNNDIVPTLPPKNWGYDDAATATLRIDTTRSPYLRPGDLWRNHNLECYLHGIAGDNGAADFKLVVDRDLALVNKVTDALKDGYPVPAKWWDANDQGTVKGVVGRWKLENLKGE